MIDCEDVKFEHPSNWLIGAQSQGGKTYFVYQLLKIADIFKPDFQNYLLLCRMADFI